MTFVHHFYPCVICYFPMAQPADRILSADPAHLGVDVVDICDAKTHYGLP